MLQLMPLKKRNHWEFLQMDTWQQIPKNLGKKKKPSNFLNTFNSQELTHDDRKLKQINCQGGTLIKNINHPNNKNPRTRLLLLNCMKIFKKKWIQWFSNYSRLFEKEWTFPNSIYEASLTLIPKPGEEKTKKAIHQWTILKNHT